MSQAQLQKHRDKIYCNFFKGPFDGAAVNETAETTFIGEIEAEYDAFKEKLGEWKAGLINQVKGFFRIFRSTIDLKFLLNPMVKPRSSTY